MRNAGWIVVVLVAAAAGCELAVMPDRDQVPDAGAAVDAAFDSEAADDARDVDLADAGDEEAAPDAGSEPCDADVCTPGP